MRRGTIKTLRVLSKRLSAKRAVARKKGMGAQSERIRKRVEIIKGLLA